MEDRIKIEYLEVKSLSALKKGDIVEVVSAHKPYIVQRGIEERNSLVSIELHPLFHPDTPNKDVIYQSQLVKESPNTNSLGELEIRIIEDDKYQGWKYKTYDEEEGISLREVPRKET